MNRFPSSGRALAARQAAIAAQGGRAAIQRRRAADINIILRVRQEGVGGLEQYREKAGGPPPQTKKGDRVRNPQAGQELLWDGTR